MSNSTTVNNTRFISFANGGCQRLIAVNENGFIPFAKGGCQSLLAVNENGFSPFANDGWQILRQSTRLGSHPLLMVVVKVYYSQREWVYNLW